MCGTSATGPRFDGLAAAAADLPPGPVRRWVEGMTARPPLVLDVRNAERAPAGRRADREPELATA